MMTGDALLEDKSRYQSHFYNRLFDISVFQIPHHGSRENWQSWLPACHPYTETWIYSYGTGNRHGHPTANFGAIRSPLKLIGLIENQLHSISGEIYYDQ
jgi:beta-lactamase superfamily II metal-dependent hydrolase